MFSEDQFQEIFASEECLYQQGRSDRIEGKPILKDDPEYINGYEAQVQVEVAVSEKIYPTVS